MKAVGAMSYSEVFRARSVSGKALSDDAVFIAVNEDGQIEDIVLLDETGENVLEGKRLPVYGNGMNVRDWLYVSDHCKAIDEVLENGRIGEVYNIGGFNEECNINIVKLIISTIYEIMLNEPQYRNLLKCSIDDINDDLIEYVKDRPGHDMRYAIDPTKIAKELGWYPETPFKEGIIKTIRWYLDNQEWVENVTSGDYQKYYESMYGNR